MEQISLDSIDLRLLQALQTDASTSNQALASKVHISPPTCLRRIKRLTELGVIERQVAILSTDKLKSMAGEPLTALVEVSLVAQTEEALASFEARACQLREVQQCYRVSPGPDFVLILQTRSMSAYHATAQQLFTQDAQVRNVKAFFSVRRAKFSTEIPLPRPNLS
jgi:Lrp/AsnC family transcriptional regulator, leucine-responsive regulatory protein